ncbi:MAG: glycosyltransferase [Planctomycetaceae bacterium]
MASKIFPALIESAARINATETEVIVVNDGSTDGTKSLIDQYGSRIIAIHQQNLRGGRSF